MENSKNKTRSNPLFCSKFQRSLLGLVLCGSAVMMPTTASASCGEDSYLGSICAVAFNFCPRGTMPAEGGLLPISQNSALFSLIGTIYGGDGRTTFALPDLRGRAMVGAGDGPGLINRRQGARYGSDTYVMSISEMPSHSHAATFTPTTGSVPVTLPATAGSQTVDLKIKALAVSSGAGQIQTPTNDAILATGNNLGGARDVKVYMPSGSSGTAVKLDGGTATVNGTPDIPQQTVAINGVVTGGKVTLTNNGGSQAMPITGPRLAIKYCIVTVGPFPSRS